MNSKAWGLSCAFDFKGADKEKISNVDSVKNYISELCKAIKMKQYGETWCEKFASHDYRLYGITVLQAIETSSVTAHFAENVGEVYLDVFSCAEYDPQVVLQFTCSYFNCEGTVVSVVNRGVFE